MKKFILTLLMIIIIPSLGCANFFVSELSTRNIVLDYKFKGEYVTVSGVKQDIEDIAVKVEGPKIALKVWKKEKKRGIWVNSKSFTVKDTVSYLFLASSKNIDSFGFDGAMKDIFDINGEKYLLEEEYCTEECDLFKEEFKSYRQHLKLYPERIEPINIFMDKIFKVTFFIPEYANIGEYIVTIYGINNGKVVLKNIEKFEVRKHGLYEVLHKLSHDHPLKHSVYAIIIALSLGLIAAFLSRNYN